jgi:hypothetical protein
LLNAQLHRLQSSSAKVAFRSGRPALEQILLIEPNYLSAAAKFDPSANARYSETTASSAQRYI